MKLPDNIRSMCSRIAHERHRASVWREAGELRKEATKRLNDGATPESMAAWADDLLRAALLGQAKR